MDQCITKLSEEIMKLVMNENTLKILNQIIDNNNNKVEDENTLSITKIGLTRKQFYTKLNELMTRGLVKREKGKYYLTTFGNIVHDLTAEYKSKLDLVLENCWKFKALDLLDISDELTNEEKHKIIEHLFDHINQHNQQNNNKDTTSPNEKVLFPYVQYLQKRNIYSNT